jgi:hypothetical protein
MLIIAVDPGLSGALALLANDWQKVLDLPTVPLEGDGGISRRVHGPALQQLVMENIPEGEEEVHAVMELLSPGGQNNRVQTSISQGRTVGTIECLLECLGLEVHRVYAQTWKRIYGLTWARRPRARTRRRRLGRSPRRCTRRSGWTCRRACDHNRAEAVLIGHWYRKCRL